MLSKYRMLLYFPMDGLCFQRDMKGMLLFFFSSAHRLPFIKCKEIQPVHPKGDQSWVFTGRTDAEAETPILWLPHVKSCHWKRP